MSVINEALKKSGQPVVAETQKNTQETKSEFRSQLLKKKTRVPWGAIFVVSLLALLTTPIWSTLFYGSNKTSVKTKEISGRSALEVSSGRMSGQFAVEESAIAPASRPMTAPWGAQIPNFSLNGLVYSKTDSYCLINGKIMRIGDRIGEATLSQVTPNEVILDYRGKKIILPANAA